MIKNPCLLNPSGTDVGKCILLSNASFFSNPPRTAACFCFHNIKHTYRKPLPSEISTNLTDATDIQLAVWSHCSLAEFAVVKMCFQVQLSCTTQIINSKMICLGDDLSLTKNTHLLLDRFVSDAAIISTAFYFWCTISVWLSTYIELFSYFSFLNSVFGFMVKSWSPQRWTSWQGCHAWHICLFTLVGERSFWINLVL